MKRFYSPKQILVIVTALLTLSILIGAVYWKHRRQKPSVRIEIANCPKLGNKGAPIQMVLFEDFRCEGCRVFNLRILPSIQSKYIESGKIGFQIVPLAFLEGSKPLANAAIAVYQIAPDRFLSYVHAICQDTSYAESDEALRQKLLNLAKVVGGIDLLAFKACLMTDCHSDVLENNYRLAKEIMGRDFGTPTLYINGSPMSSISLRAIETKIQELSNQ